MAFSFTPPKTGHTSRIPPLSNHTYPEGNGPDRTQERGRRGRLRQSQPQQHHQSGLVLSYIRSGVQIALKQRSIYTAAAFVADACSSQIG